MNNPFVLRQVRAFTGRLRREAHAIPSQIELGYRLAFGRSPTSDESRQAASLAAQHGLDSVAWTLINASEFVYVR